MPLIRNPRRGGRDRDQTTLLPVYAFANRIDGIMSVPQADRPAIKAAQCADSPPDGRRGELRRSEEHTSELQSHLNLVCRLLLEKKKTCERTTTYPYASA